MDTRQDANDSTTADEQTSGIATGRRAVHHRRYGTLIMVDAGNWDAG